MEKYIVPVMVLAISILLIIFIWLYISARKTSKKIALKLEKYKPIVDVEEEKKS